jgi:glycosyltransferase involved in cell wall biosynthesis
VPNTHELSRSQPLLSVLTAAYNAEPYLPACIESVLSQTHGDLELLIVDDGSRDTTSEIVAHYAARDPRVRGFRGPNRGTAHARNVAMRHARGQFFALLDSDDVWEPTFAAEQVQLLQQNPQLGIVSGNGRNLGGGALDGLPVLPWPAEPRTVRFIDLIEHVDIMFIMSVFRREVYETLGGFNESLYRSEDYEYWLRAAASGFLIQTNPRPLALYRRRADSISADQPAMFESIIRVLELAREFRQRPRAEELGAIDLQLDRLRAGRLLTLGKAALLRQDFVEARTHFRELHRRGQGLRYGAMAAALRFAPALVRSAYRHRLQLLARRAGQTG